MERLFERLLRILFSVLFSVVQSMVGGFVLSKLWAWFINPKFTSAPALNYLDCVGVMQVVGFALSGLGMALGEINARLKPKDEDETALGASIAKNLAMILIVYPTMLLVGFTWHQFIGT